MGLHGRRANFLLCCVIGFVLSGCAPRPDPDVSAELARVYGECTFTLNTTLLDMPEIAVTDERYQMIQSIVDGLVKERYQQFPWKVHTKLFEYPVPNAFTTGGGYLAAFTGVYAMADDEAALAGVIAHELSHMATVDTMEIATYLESMLALQLAQSGVSGEYDSGQALRTVVDFCLAIPGLVDRKWKDDLNTVENSDVDAVYGDAAVPHIPYTYSDDPESAYYSESRDPEGVARQSACNINDREVVDEFVIINPDYYLTNYLDSGSLPPIPDNLGGGIGGLPSTEILWQTQPWLQFQQTAFMRYAECQADEGSMLNLLAAGYNPLALNQSFARMIDLFDIDESTSDWRFINHPSLGQRIEDNRAYIASNTDVLPSLSELDSPENGFSPYVFLVDQIEAFETARDVARSDLFVGKSAQLRSNTASAQVDQAAFEPITAVDLAVLLMEEFSTQTQRRSQIGQTQDESKCEVYSRVYEKLTGKSPLACRVAD